MFFCMKAAVFAIHGLAVCLFVHYLRFSHLYDEYFDRSCDEIVSSKTYDYIVVGAGSAGCVLASRLADFGGETLLLEAGGTPPPFINIPIITPLLQQSVYDWQHTSVPQKDACRGLINNQSRWPMGKILGGTSRLNYMVYVRGHRHDFYDWFPDFIEPRFEEGGPLSVITPQWYTQLSDAILDAVSEMGQAVGNINRDIDTGFMRAELTMKNGERWSSDRLLDVKYKHQLSVIANAYVNEVLFESNKAVGVEFVKLGRILRARARKGVILSAGAIGSPKLLMLSGIGPEEHLKELKIPVRSNLPVGQNLLDHIITGVDLVVLNTSLPLTVSNILNPISAFNYFVYGEGPWTSAGIEVLGTFHSSFTKNNTTAPDLQLMVMPVGVSQDDGISMGKAMGFSDEVFKEYFAPLTDRTAVTIAPVLLHPESTGEVRLRSSDPSHPPLIDPKYLSKEQDVRVLIDGIQFVKKLVQTEAMQRLGATLYRKPFPGCEAESFDTADYWECYVRHVTLTTYHPVGTCRLGSVVDDSFRVYNVSNLYVVDASVLLLLPSGNINAAVVMLAEKAARLIASDKSDNRANNYNQSQCNTLDVIQYVFRVNLVDNR